MIVRLIIRPRAEKDVAQGFAWYESRRAGLGAEYLKEVTSVLENIQLESLRFPLTLGPIRRALVHRFPYGIFFICQRDAIAVIAVMHLARNPHRVRRPRS